MEDREERLRAHTTELPGAVEPVEDGQLADGPADRREPASTAMRAPVHGRVRIAGLEAGVAAGLVAPPDAVEDEAGVPSWPDLDSPEEVSISNALRGVDEPVGPEVTAPALPDWRDPPTREVPAVLLQHPAAEQGPNYPGPVWREDQGDWDDEDLAFAEIVQEGTTVGDHGLGIDEPDPFGFDFPMASVAGTEAVENHDVARAGSTPLSDEPTAPPAEPVAMPLEERRARDANEHERRRARRDGRGGQGERRPPQQARQPPGTCDLCRQSPPR